MPNLDRILETALYVDHLEQAADFYVNILGLRRLFRDDRLQAFSVGGQSVLLLFQRGASLETTRLPGGTIPPHDGHGPLHIAFAIANAAFKFASVRLSAFALTPLAVDCRALAVPSACAVAL